ncbi:MAG: hypothetical protein ACE5EX_06990 [Phycisphaerae bacterium]
MLGSLRGATSVVGRRTGWWCQATLFGGAAMLIGCSQPVVAQEHGGGMSAMGVPGPGLHAYARSRGKNPSPPDRIGGALKVTVNKRNASTRFMLPGTRRMDPAIFGTPEHPAGFEPAPFPMSGVPLNLRLEADDHFTIVDHACPFSDWYEKGTGSVKMKLVDATGIDGAYTRDKIDFEATFKLPDGANYRVVCKKPLAHGGAFPFFGGVVTNHLIHGGAGIAPRLLPTAFAYAAFWGAGDVYKDGSLINKGQLVHVWVSDDIRGAGDRTRTDAEAGNPSKGITLHMVVPPYKPTPKGMVKAPLKTMFMPFPYVKPNIMAEMKTAKGAGDQARVAEVMQIKSVMDKTKDHVVHATAEGKMFGMPFIHMKFDGVSIKARH